MRNSAKDHVKSVIWESFSSDLFTGKWREMGIGGERKKIFFYFSSQLLPLESLYPLLLRFGLEVKSWSTKLYLGHNVSWVIISLFLHQFHFEKKERWTRKHFVTLETMQGTVSHSFSASRKLAREEKTRLSSD